jgi:phosphatidate cytidylyltransferase
MMAIILTIPFCVIGMLGDLFASAIKRSVDLKDYGSLIPGHGGILDRLDSMLLIAPVFYIVILSGVI